MIALDICETVEKAGYAVLGPVPSAEKALSLLEGERPAAALLDETLDQTSVFPVAEALSRKGIPFVIVSGHVRSPSHQPLLREARRIEKPPSPSQIRTTLAALLAERED